MMRSTMILALTAVAAAGCGDKVQEVGSSPVRKLDTQAWQATAGAYTAAGWTTGDKASWEAQMRTRAQTQNESVRIGAATPAAAAAPVSTKTP